MNLALDAALDAMTAPIRLWQHYPDSEGKDAIREAYGELSGAERGALAADVLRAVREHHGGDTVTAYRKGKRQGQRLRGLTSLSTDPGFVKYLKPSEFSTYEVPASKILAHWGQDLPLGKGMFKHEKEIITLPDAELDPVVDEQMTTANVGNFVGAPVGPVLVRVYPEPSQKRRRWTLRRRIHRED